MKSLKQLYSEHIGKSSDKWGIYLNVYDDLLSDRRSNIHSLLEIGVQNGGSLEIWSNYFSAINCLVGCDINKECERLSYENHSINLVIGDSSTFIVKEKIKSISSEFDLVIDDGSHISSDIIKSFLLYFPLLTNEGIYIVEDLHASYWKDFEGGLYYPYSSMSFLKKLADVINSEHWGNELPVKEFLDPFYKFHNCEDIDDVDYSTIHSITFVNSLCIIKKKKIVDDNLLGSRYIAGNKWEVFLATNERMEKISPKMQLDNPWSRASSKSHIVTDCSMEDYILNKRQVSALESKLSNLQQEYALRISLIENDLNREVESNKKLNFDINAILNSTSWRITYPLRAIVNYFRKIFR